MATNRDLLGGLTIWIALALTGCSDQARIETVLTLTGDTTNGQSVYSNICEECHAADLTGTSEGPKITDIIPLLSDSRLLEIAIRGEDEMPSFGDEMTDQELADLLAFLRLVAP